MDNKKGYLTNKIKIYFFGILIIASFFTEAQTPVFSNTPVSDNGSNNTIGSANTSRNVAVDFKGNIYVVYANSSEIRVAKSINGGQSFSSSLLVGSFTSNSPELAINRAGHVFISWNEGGTLFLSTSQDEGQSFSTPRSIGTEVNGTVHMSTHNSNVYIIDQSGANLYSNNSNGEGAFNLVQTGTFMVYADVLTDENGIVYAPMDDPNLRLFKSENQGISVTEQTLNPAASVFFSSYALSDGPCGTFIFVGGGSNPPSDTLGYKIDANTGETSEITLGFNGFTAEGRTLYADDKGTLIDGYRTDEGDLMINVSSNQGETFNAPIRVANGESHNIARSPTTNNVVVVYESSGQIFVSVYSDVLKNIELISPSPPISICGLEDFDISFTLTGVFNENSTFTAILSNENGNFSDESIEIGSVSGNTNGMIMVTIPENLPSSDLYRIKIESLENCIQSNTIPLIIGEAIIEGDSQVCIDESIQLTGSDTPSSSQPWVSSNTNVAIIDDSGQLTGVNEGITEITYRTNDGCFGKYEVEVFSLPVLNDEVTLKNCEDENGISTFNLTEANQDIVTNLAEFTFSYFESELEAQSNGTSITNFNAYQNQEPSIDAVWARVENDKGCYQTSKINLIVSTTQIPVTFIRTIFECDDGDNTSDGIATFDFSEVTNDVLAIFPANQQLIITYHESEKDALTKMNKISDSEISNYQNIVSPEQKIYIRVESALDDECLGVGHHITLIVESKPEPNSVTITPGCDNDRDGVFAFDSSGIESALLGNQTNVTVTYTGQNGEALSSPLPNPFITATQTITARLMNATSKDSDGQCFAEEDIDFVVNLVPFANEVEIQELCDDDHDGSVEFDTTELEALVLGSQSGLIVEYFNEAGDALSSPLPNPFNTVSQTLTVRVENPDNTSCFEETSIEFIVREKPKVELPEETFICLTDSPSQMLSVIDPNTEYDYAWFNDSQEEIGTGISITVNEGGIYSVIATSIFECESFKSEIRVIDSEIAKLSADFITVIDNSENNSIVINPLNLGVGVYEYALLDVNQNVIVDFQDTPSFENLEGGIYIILVQDKNGCGIAQQEVSVISYPKFFTPNNDAFNDTWGIKGFSSVFYPSSVFYIYDRYGKLLAELPASNPVWDGIFRGKTLPATDYWFSVQLKDINGNSRVIKGHFSLVR